MNIVLDNYTPLISYLSPASIPQIVAHIQEYLVNHPILSVQTVAEIIVQSLQEHPELLNGEAIPISADSEQSIKAYIDGLPFLDTYTKAEINALLLGKQDTLTFDQAPTPGSSNPVTSSGIIAALSALQTALETQIGLKADSASTYTKTQVDTLLEDKADADNVYSKNTIDAKLLEVDTELDNVNDALDEQSQQIDDLSDEMTNVQNGLATPSITGTVNNTGNTIIKGTYFRLNDVLCFAFANIADGATFTENSNYRIVSEGGLNALGSVTDFGPSITATENATISNVRANKCGRIALVSFFISVTAVPSSGWTYVLNIPDEIAPYVEYYGVAINDNNFNTVEMKVNSNGISIWNPEIDKRYLGSIIYITNR